MSTVFRLTFFLAITCFGLQSSGYAYDGCFSLAAETTVAAEAKGGTYLLRDAETGQVMRTGRTNDLARRAAEHARDPVLRDFEFEPVHRTDVYNEQRGLPASVISVASVFKQDRNQRQSAQSEADPKEPIGTG